MDREIELKLEGDPEALERLAHMRDFDELNANVKSGDVSAQTLRSTYFDTADFTLMDHGFALRVREVGTERIQTLKSSRRDGGPASDRGEWEQVLHGDSAVPDVNRLPGDLKTRILDLTGTKSLDARIVSTIQRRAIRLHTNDGGEIELVFDLGAIEASGRALKVSELELELKRGVPADLYRVALHLAELAPLRIGMRSKAERGVALARGFVPEAMRAPAIELSEKASVEEAYARILNHCLTHFLANQAAALDGHAPEGLHQMRVSLRRLRSALLVFGRVFEGEAEDDLMREAKWLMRAIGRARDYDVFLASILAPVLSEASGDKTMQALHRAAQKQRDMAWAKARETMAGPRATKFILRLALYLETQAWRETTNKDMRSHMAQPVGTFAARALDKRLKSVVKLARQIDELDVSDRHELRKRLKKFRYTMSFFASLYSPERSKTYLARLSDLQDMFGSLNDLEMAQSIVNELTDHNRRYATAGAKLLARHETKAERDWHLAQTLWVKFRQEPLFWRG